MKKIVILFFLLLIPLASAVEFEVKPVYDKGETLIASVSGNFLDPILPENIYFYRGHIRVPFFYDVAKINDNYYIYALLTDTQVTPSANYSIVIKDIRYYKGSQVIEDELQRNFTISENLVDFSANPGFIITNQNFFIKVQNLQESQIDISYSTFSNSSESINLKSGEIKKINFDISGIKQTTFESITISSANTLYEIPVYIIANATAPELPPLTNDFRFNPVDMNFSAPINDRKTKYIYLYNTGQSTLKEIELTVSDELLPYVNLSADFIEELEQGSEIKIEMYIESSENISVEGFVFAINNELFIELPIRISFIKDYVPLPNENGDGGFENENRSNPPLPKPNGDGNKLPIGKIIGYGILVILLLALIWFYFKKYRKAGRKVDILKVGERGFPRKSGLPPRPRLKQLDLDEEPKRVFGLRPKED